MRVDQKGNAWPLVGFKVPFAAPRFSPEGLRIAYRSMGMEWRLCVYDLDRGTESRLTVEGRVGMVAWTPAGKRLVFGWLRSGFANLQWQSADGSSPMQRLTMSENEQQAASFTPDGAMLAFVETNPETGWDIMLLDMKSCRVKPFLNSKAGEGWLEVSPDGRWLSYASDESGRMVVWVHPFPGMHLFSCTRVRHRLTGYCQ